MSAAFPTDPAGQFNNARDHGARAATGSETASDANPDESGSQIPSTDENQQVGRPDSVDTQGSVDAVTPQGDAAPSVTSIATLTDCLKAMERQLLESFEQKLAYDAFKEKQIERLHNELQEYKRGLADSLLLPLIQQLVRYVDQIPRHIEALRKKPAEELGPERLGKELQGVREDLEMILENVGVAIVQSTEPKFDPRCQQAPAPNRRTIPATTELSRRGFCPDIPLTAS